MYFFITEAKVSWTMSYLKCVYWTLVFYALFHFLKNWLCVLSVTLVVSDSLWTHGLWPTSRLLSPWDFPSKNTGVYCYALLQGIFLTQGWNPCLLQCRRILYPLSHLGSGMRLQGSKLYPEGRIQPKAHLCKQSFIGTLLRLLIYVWSTTAFTIRAEPSSCDRGHLA